MQTDSSLILNASPCSLSQSSKIKLWRAKTEIERSKMSSIYSQLSWNGQLREQIKWLVLVRRAWGLKKENKPLFCRLSNTKSYRTVNEWLVIWFVIWCHVCLSCDVVSAFRNSRSDKVNRQTTSVKSSTGRKGRSNESYFATRPYYYPHTPLLRRHSSADPRSHKRYLTTKRLVPDYHTMTLLTNHQMKHIKCKIERACLTAFCTHSSMFITCFISIAIWQILYLYKLSF